MSRRTPFTLMFAPETLDHLDAIERRHHRLIEKTIDEQLASTPDRETRNRKPLERRGPFESTWELRFGPNNRFRVFYQVDRDEGIVWILAIGIKNGDQLFIGGEGFQA